MTIVGPETAGAPEDNTPVNSRYHISLPRLEQLNRSAVHLIAARLTEACPSHGQPVTGLNAETLIREIRQFHDDTPDFIRADMPIQEIIFRILLARGNDPMTLIALHRELTEQWSGAFRPISIDIQRLRRVLNADSYYGFTEL